MNTWRPGRGSSGRGNTWVSPERVSHRCSSGQPQCLFAEAAENPVTIPPKSVSVKVKVRHYDSSFLTARWNVCSLRHYGPPRLSCPDRSAHVSVRIPPTLTLLHDHCPHLLAQSRDYLQICSHPRGITTRGSSVWIHLSASRAVMAQIISPPLPDAIMQTHLAAREAGNAV